MEEKISLLLERLNQTHFKHPEGPRYAYLVLISIQREMMELSLEFFRDKNFCLQIAAASSLLNALLCENFSDYEEKVFREKYHETQKILLLLVEEFEETSGDAAA